MSVLLFDVLLAVKETGKVQSVGQCWVMFGSELYTEHCDVHLYQYQLPSSHVE